MAEVEGLSGNDEALDDTLELGSAEAPQVDVDGNPVAAIEPLDEEFPETFDEEDEVKNPHLVAQLRERLNAETRRTRELEQRLTAPKIVRTPEPTLESCDYDEDRLKAATRAWDKNEAEADEQERAPAPSQNDQAQEFQSALSKYQAGKAKIGAAAQVSEDAVLASLSKAQQSAILLAVKNPAQFFHALGRSPNRLAALSLITNPITLAGEAARIEGKSTMPRKEPANIDTPLRGSAPLSQAGTDKELERLEKEADRTGDRSKVISYKREKRQKAAA